MARCDFEGDRQGAMGFTCDWCDDGTSVVEWCPQCEVPAPVDALDVAHLCASQRLCGVILGVEVSYRRSAFAKVRVLGRSGQWPRAQRNPMLLLRMLGSLLLRFAARASVPPLFQEPPRMLRLMQKESPQARPSAGAPT